MKEEQLGSIMLRHFGDWRITNYGVQYSGLRRTRAHEPHSGMPQRAVARKGSDTQKNNDAQLHMRCHALAGRRKSTAEVMDVGRQAFAIGAGVCTTSAFAVAYKLLEEGIQDRIEIIGQGSLSNGHMWVVIGRDGDTEVHGTGASRKRIPDDEPATWGNYLVADAWLRAFGWPGFYRKPANGRHHSFIDARRHCLSITYDSLEPEGDDY